MGSNKRICLIALEALRGTNGKALRFAEIWAAVVKAMGRSSAVTGALRIRFLMPKG